MIRSVILLSKGIGLFKKSQVVIIALSPLEKGGLRGILFEYTEKECEKTNLRKEQSSGFATSFSKGGLQKEAF